MTKSRTWLRYSGYALLAAALLIIFYAIIAALAWRSGQATRTEQAQANLVTEISRQLELAHEDIDAGNIALAERRLEELQGWSPDDPDVLSLAATIGAMSASPLPTPLVIVAGDGTTTTATPITPTPSDTPTLLPPVATQPNRTPQPAALETRLNTLETMVTNEQWEDAIRELVAFQIDYPNYERFRTNSLLFEAYLGAGFFFTNGNRVTLGINYFEQAEKLGTLPENAISQLYYSRTYLTGVSYFGINWEVSVNALNEICTTLPGFHDACDLLVEARIGYGDQLAAANEPCSAQFQYAQALRTFNSSDLREKWNTAKWDCENPSPTATPTSDAVQEGPWTPTPQPGQGPWTPTPQGGADG